MNHWRVTIKSILILLLLINSYDCFSQQSSLVYLNDQGNLEYTEYSNTGEDTAIHVIPDFSHAGYKGGGVTLPNVPVVITLNAVSGDNKALIQDAIDQVSAMPVDANGFRGAILLKAGKYDISGPLFISESGVVLQGEGQDLAGNQGTQLHATASFQHDLINFSGDSYAPKSTLPHLDTIVVPQREIIGTDTTDGDIWLNANVLEAIEGGVASTQVISLWMYANNTEFTSYHSKENTNSPYISITFRPDGKDSDSTFTIKPTDDTYVRSGANSDVNYSDKSLLEMKNQGVDNDFSRECFLKFEIPEITGALISAELSLWCSNAGNSSDQEHYITHIFDNDWDELTLTYNSRPNTGFVNNQIVTGIVPVGAYSFEIDNASEYEIGDMINVVRTPNQFWIDDLQMGQFGWLPAEYIVSYEREITQIKGDTISVNIPIVQAIDTLYGGGYIASTDYSNRISNCGVENMLISSQYTNSEDEAHGWTAIKFENTENCWVTNVSAQYFGYSCISLDEASYTTIQDCAMLDPVSITTGSRKYSFNIDNGSFNLFQRCYTRGGRHDYITGSRVAGPNVFLDCVSENTLNDIGPHQRYATGILFDNIRGGQMRVQNRRDMGTGHGWAGAQTMFWNLEAMDFDIKVESPKGAMNWGIGCSAEQKDGAGFWESWNEKVVPRSLYLQQLKDRLGEDSLRNVAIELQNSDTILRELEIWGGMGKLEDATRRTYKKSTMPGKIEFEQFDVGRSNESYLDNSIGNSGFSSRYTDVDIFSGSNFVGGDRVTMSYIGDTEDYEWLEYTVDAIAGSYMLNIQYSATAPNQKLIVFSDEVVIDTFLLAETESNINFEIAEFDFELNVTDTIVIKIEILGENLLLDWFEVKLPSESATGFETAELTRVFPNPFSNVLTIESENQLVDISVYNQLGQIQKSIVGINSRSVSISLNDLPNGMYIVRTRDVNNTVSNNKVFKY